MDLDEFLMEVRRIFYFIQGIFIDLQETILILGIHIGDIQEILGPGWVRIAEG